MDFINKHYEKLILLAVLIIFVIGMVFVLGTLDKTSEVKDTDLKIPTRSADYEGTASKEPKSEDVWKSSNFAWHRAQARKAANAEVCYSDLVTFDSVALCPFCNKLVPIAAFNDKKCPNAGCNNILKKAPDRPKFRRNIITADDSDGDGMKDLDESKYGLDKSDPKDALYDKDGDGFSNYFEIISGTNPDNFRSHPPLWTRLRVVDMRTVELPISFRAVSDNGSNKPEDWDCQFNITNIDRKTGKVRLHRRTKKPLVSTRMIRINETMDIEGTEFRLVKIDRIIKARTEKADAKKNSTGNEKDKFIDESVAYFTKVTPRGDKFDNLTMQVGKPAHSPDVRPIFADDGLLPDERKKPENFMCFAEGQRFQLGRGRNIERYVVISFDEKSKTVVLHRDRVPAKQDPKVDVNGKEMKVTAEGGIPEDSRIVPVEAKAGNAGNFSEN